MVAVLHRPFEFSGRRVYIFEEGVSPATTWLCSIRITNNGDQLWDVQKVDNRVVRFSLPVTMREKPIVL